MCGLFLWEKKKNQNQPKKTKPNNKLTNHSPTEEARLFAKGGTTQQNPGGSQPPLAASAALNHLQEAGSPGAALSERRARRRPEGTAPVYP